MYGTWGASDAGRKGTRRNLRKQRERDRKLLLKHRWYSGVVAVVVAGALAFSGTAPAYAEEPAPPTDTATTATTDSTATDASTAEAAPPADPAPPADQAATADPAPVAPVAPVAPAAADPAAADTGAADASADDQAVTDASVQPQAARTVDPTVQQQALAAPLAALSACSGWPVAGSPVAGFEIDGNLCDDPAAGVLDWATVGGQPRANDLFDDATQFTGGSKESNWPWSGAQTSGSGTAPGKTDIGNVYAYTQTVGGSVYAYLGFERQENNGSVSYHVELNQKTNLSGPVPNRTAGDLRLTLEQNGSNVISLVGADRWNGTAWVSLGNLSGFVGQVNQGAIDNLSGGTVEAGIFSEAAINLTALFGDAGCSGTYGVLNVRSSSSPEDTSSLGDWINPIALSVPSTCSTLTILKTNTSGAPLAGAQFTIAPNPATGTGSTTGTTDATGKIVFSGNVKPGTYTVTETVAPAGYLLPTPAQQTATFGATAESKTLTFVDPLGTVSWVKHDDGGKLLGGATFVITATSGAASLAPWDLDTSPITVVDNTGQPGYTGRDTDTDAGEFLVTGLPIGAYSLKETVAPANYGLDPSTKTFSIAQGAANPVVSAAFVNHLLVGTLAITKSLTGAGVRPGTAFSGTYTCTDPEGSAGTWSVTGAGAATLTPTTGDLNILVGTQCTVTENALAQSLLVDVSYAWNTPVITQAPAIVAGQTVTATVANSTKRVYGSLQIAKALQGITLAGLTNPSFSGSWSCTYGTGQGAVQFSGTWSVAGTGAATLTGPSTALPLTSTCTVSENAPSNALFSDPSYTWMTPVIAPTPATISSTTPVTVTVTNPAERATLTLVKVVQNDAGGTKAPADWNQKLTATSTVAGSPAIRFDTGTAKGVKPGEYAIGEDQLAGYDWTALTCTIDGAPVGGVGLGDKTLDIGPGDAGVCTLTNDDIAPTLRLQKQIVNDGGGTHVATEWQLTAYDQTRNAPAIQGFGSIVQPDLAEINAAVEAGHPYQLSENGPSGYTAGSWTCWLTGTQTPAALVAGSVTLQLAQDVTCRIVNNDENASGTITKDVVPGYPVQNADGTWTIRYDIKVTNGSAFSTYTYNLADAFDFGGGITPSNGAIISKPAGVTTSATWNGTTDTTIATGVALPGGQTHTYRVEVRATLAAGVEDGDTWQCVPGDDGGFLNTTAIYRPGQNSPDGTARACAEPSFPSIDKSNGTATPNSNGTWNVSFDIAVTNDGATAIDATVTDTWPTLPAGWSLQGPWTVTAKGGSPAPTNSTSAGSPLWHGTLPANTTYTWTVSAVLVPSAFAQGFGTCENQKGLINSAVVVSGSADDQDSDCVNIVSPPVDVAKSVASVQQLADGTWQIDYTVTVHNTSATYPTVYTLSDTPSLGDGFSVVTADWQGTAPAANTPIAADATHVYTYRIVAQRTAAPQAELRCDGPGSAFFNGAVVTFPGGSDSASACAEPASPVVFKTGSAAVQNPSTGEWTLTYTVTVSNESSIPLAYTLADTPAALPGGTTLTTAWAVGAPAADPTGAGTFALTPGWNGGGQAQIATGTLPAGASHAYTVTAGITVAPTADPDGLQCDEDGESGFWNAASVTNGIVPDDAEACISILPVPVTIEKSDATVNQLADGDWQADYEVTVSNSSATLAATYGLIDTPQFDPAFTVVSAAWIGDPQPQVVNVLAPNASVTYTYRVVAHYTGEPGATDGTCDEEGGAFFNTATVTFPGGTDTDSGCGEPASPTITKTPKAPTQDAVTGQWTIAYDVVVANPSAQTLVYTADDTAAALPAGVTGVGDWTASGPVIIVGGSGSLNGAWAGSGELATGVLVPGATHTYTVSRVVTVAPTADPDALDCSQEPGGSGFWNGAQVTNGYGEDEASACVEITPPGVTIDKTVTGVEHLLLGNWQITYDVVVTNTSSSLTAVYDLADQLKFGGDIEVVDASWTGPGGADGDFDLATDAATLAAARTLGGGASHTYTVTVIAKVELADFSGDTLACEEEGSLEAGGFLNTATVTAAGDSDTADACAEPKLPKIEKTGLGAIQNPQNASQWLVSYLITVTPSGFDDHYRLDDIPGFPVGVSLGDGLAQRVDLANQPLSGFPLIHILANKILDNVEIGANDAPHRYLVTWLADVTNTVTEELGTCVSTQSGRGFYNTATMTVGGIPLSDDACIPVQQAVYPTIAKTVTSAVQDPDTGTWTITYDVAVSLSDNDENLASEYTLTDELGFGAGIEVTDASWTGPTGAGDFDLGDGTATMATDRTIADGVTEHYTVTVEADVTAAAIEDETTACTETPGSGFFNTATLTAFGQEEDASACAQPALPSIEKSGESSVQNPDGTWTVSYLLTVRHAGPVQDPAVGAAYVLSDIPAALPDGVEPTSGADWHAEPAGDATPDTADDATPAPADDSWRHGEGTWVIGSGTLTQSGAGSAVTYRVSATVDVTAPPVLGEDEDLPTCTNGEATESGIVIDNSATVTSGAYEDSDDACEVVQYDDVSLTKTAHLAEGETSVEPNDEYTYTLEVTNNGTRDATDVRVLDDSLDVEPYASRVDITAVEWDPALSVTDDSDIVDHNIVDLTIASLAAGQTTTITVTVTFLPDDTVSTVVENLVGDDPPAPEFDAPLASIDNTACVSAANDEVESNNCDSESVETRDITGVVYTRCVSDAPYLGFFVRTTPNLSDDPITATWTTLQEPQVDGHSLVLGPYFAGPDGVGRNDIVWPGAEFTPSGVAIDYPGWRQLEASDYGPNGGYINPADGLEYAPEDAGAFVFNGLILDPSEIDFAWRDGTQIVFSVNPTLTFNVSYPAATPECFQARHSNVVIDKNASVERTAPGNSFDYTLAVQNVTDDSAADGVVVTDTIPADLKITDVTWTGKGDDAVFPNWETCAVTGQNGQGYGGTLTCDLFGPLQPGESAPTITLNAFVNPASSATQIANTGVVDYYTFDNPEDTGRAADSVTVYLTPLAVTGATLGLWSLWAGLAALFGGAALLYVNRRRKKVLRSDAE
ncbi:DUF11 domain-containing protein [Microbacterium sp. 4R-513]|uniref:SpaA isopeptide-forming pilin-related protein n=1 Tax=Microbacterium sp. 4R-513 TaxID=2567934 RepID=UPI0013E17052|nr:SpaA isopeptide-forming pilin-related protein [Microbacterium sp. 4R-513]QIG38593.1 DUF11 domain-containing protein [Microbacterium sp. 4R-513]